MIRIYQLNPSCASSLNTANLWIKRAFYKTYMVMNSDLYLPWKRVRVNIYMRKLFLPFSVQWLILVRRAFYIFFSFTIRQFRHYKSNYLKILHIHAINFFTYYNNAADLVHSPGIFNFVLKCKTAPHLRTRGAGL